MTQAAASPGGKLRSRSPKSLYFPVFSCILDNEKTKGGTPVKKHLRHLLALLLLIAAVAGLSVPAEAAGVSYPENQYFKKDENLTKGRAVQIQACKTYEAACTARDALLKKGLDCYIYDVGDSYRIMCGKFSTADEALHYQEAICIQTGKSDPYTNNVYLPDWAYEEFAEIYKKDPLNNQGQPFKEWEKPSGAFVWGDRAENTRRVYTVQFSSGTCFTSMEQNRDKLIAGGYDAFVYKEKGWYYGMVGAFDNQKDAEALCSEIKTYLNRTDTKVREIYLPGSTPTPTPTPAPTPTPTPAPTPTPTPAPTPTPTPPPTPAPTLPPTQKPLDNTSEEGESTAEPPTEGEGEATPSAADPAAQVSAHAEPVQSRENKGIKIAVLVIVALNTLLLAVFLVFWIRSRKKRSQAVGRNAYPGGQSWQSGRNYDP